MATPSGTNFNTSTASGYVIADGFLGAPSANDTAHQQLSTSPALFPNGSTVTGAQVGGFTTVAAAGASQGTATAIPATAYIVNVTVTTSTEGVKLPTPSTGREMTLLTPTTKGYKVYTNLAGQVINAATTATTAFAVATLKPVTFYGVDATHWRAQRGG